MTIEIEALSTADTAYKLRRELGDARNWHDFLADCIRGRTSYRGLRLIPVAGVVDRCRRPVYDLREVDEFVRAVLLRDPPASAPEAIRPFRVRIETCSARVPYSMRRAERLAGSTAS